MNDADLDLLEATLFYASLTVEELAESVHDARDCSSPEVLLAEVKTRLEKAESLESRRKLAHRLWLEACEASYGVPMRASDFLGKPSKKTKKAKEKSA